jgi:hypothetical protein
LCDGLATDITHSFVTEQKAFGQGSPGDAVSGGATATEGSAGIGGSGSGGVCQSRVLIQVVDVSRYLSYYSVEA